MTGSPDRTPAQDGFRMPPEYAQHERTLMAWPCRPELWGSHLEAAKIEYAGVANAIAAFEPVTMVAADEAAAADARGRLTGSVEVVEMPLDDSWIRDNGPTFALDENGRRAGVHFRFNAWGGKFEGWDRDEAAGGMLATEYGDVSYEAPFILEGGSILIGADGRLLTTEQCLLSESRNPNLSKAQLDTALRSYLGASDVIWLGRGLREDRDTDGHIDGIAFVTDDGTLVLQSRVAGDPDHENMADNHDRAVAAGLRVVDFSPFAVGELGGEPISLVYLNLYLCNGAAIVPLAGGPAADLDNEALDILRSLLPGREVVGVPAIVISYGGGGPHCITQQVPARGTA
jgi:agmatine deiminase